MSNAALGKMADNQYIAFLDLAVQDPCQDRFVEREVVLFGAQNFRECSVVDVCRLWHIHK